MSGVLGGGKRRGWTHCFCRPVDGTDHSYIILNTFECCGGCGTMWMEFGRRFLVDVPCSDRRTGPWENPTAEWVREQVVLARGGDTFAIEARQNLARAGLKGYEALFGERLQGLAAPTWTKEIPTKPGWYVAWREGGIRHVWQLYKNLGQAWVSPGDYTRKLWNDEERRLWAGCYFLPIFPPERQR